MSSSARLDAALMRFGAALDRLETAAGRFSAHDTESQRLRDTISAMQRELETSLTRTQVLEQATADIATRLGKAGGTLRRLLGAGTPPQVPDEG